jgi:methyl-accepting chemotaxis protein
MKSIKLILTIIGLVAYPIIFLIFNPWSLGVKIVVYILCTSFVIILLSKIYFKLDREYKKAIIALKRDREYFDSEIQVASSQIAAVSEELYINLEESNSMSNRLFSNTGEMEVINKEVNDNIQIAMTETKGVINLFGEVSSTIFEMENSSTESGKIVENSKESILKIVNTIEEIHIGSDKTIEYVNNLNNQSQEIASILNTVNAILKQTQLLALNASIESARAGEAGKGFAVVAGEIGKLAINTGLAVQGIEEHISLIQNEIQNVYTVVKDNYYKVEEGVEVSRSIGDELSKIEVSFKELIEMLKLINVTSQEEIAITEQISGTIENVEAVIIRSKYSVDEVKQSVQEQKINSSQMYELGAKLKIASENLEKLVIKEEQLENIEVIKQGDKIKENFIGIVKKFQKNDAFIALTKEAHQRLLTDIVVSKPYIKAIWTNDIKGRFICSIPEAGIANAGARDWFKHSIKGEIYSSSIYISAIDKKPCITLSMPIMNKNNNIIGVIGIDSEP